MNKKSFLFAVLTAALLLLSACAQTEAPAEEAPSAAGTSAAVEEPVVNSTVITLSDSGIEVNGGGARASSNVVQISAVGTYTVTGAIQNGQILIDTGDDKVDVTLILDNADITNPAGPAIYIRQAKNARLQLAAGSQNRVTSGTEEELSAGGADSSGAAIYAEDDLDIEGEGALEVLGYSNNGIACKDDLDINSGTIVVLAANNGLRASESVEIKGGTLRITAGNDGVKTTSAKKEGKGYVTLSSGDVEIVAAGDGISAETELRIEGGTLSVTTTGDPDVQSSKALKAKTGLTISGGELTLEATDHAVHSAAGLSIQGGTLTVTSLLGKAIAAHDTIEISGGELTLFALSDGVETPGDIRISGGTLTLCAGDDGLQAGETNSGAGTIEISSGVIGLSAHGQSLNARGQVVLTGGTVLALSGSDKAPALASGGQLTMLVGWSGPGDCEVTVSDGETILGSVPSRWTYKNVFFSAPELNAGVTYTIANNTASTKAQAGV